MKQLFFISCFLISVLSNNVNAQRIELSDREKFVEAESYYLFEEFKDAILLYLQLYKDYPDNYNIAFKIGRCYYEDPYNKEKSIRFLETASQNVAIDAKSKSFKETNAPPETWYYLGNAYRVNRKYQKAIDAYQEFKVIADEEEFDFQLVNDQITACKNSLNAKPDPGVLIQKKEVSEYFNDRFAQTHPVISGNGNSFVYVSELQFYDAVFYSKKENGKWTPPLNLIPELKVDGDIYPTAFNYDGTVMYIYRIDGYDGNIWVAELIDGKWKNLRKLGDNINSKYWESHASVNKEEDKLYFSSNRKGGFGDLDIYVASLKDDGTWGEAYNLGAKINTRYNDDSPYITMDGQKLYFNSYGHKNFGGYDILYSRLNEQGGWSSPVNMGIALNGPDDETHFIPFKNGDYIYLSRFERGNKGRSDIYLQEIFSDNHRKEIQVAFQVQSEKTELALPNLKVSVYSTSENELIQQVSAENVIDEIQMRLPHGEYYVVFSGSNIQEKRELIEIPLRLTDDIYFVNTTVRREKNVEDLPKGDVVDQKPEVREDQKVETLVEEIEEVYEKPRLKVEVNDSSVKKIDSESVESESIESESIESEFKRQEEIYKMIIQYYNILFEKLDSMSSENQKRSYLTNSFFNTDIKDSIALSNQKELIHAINLLLKELSLDYYDIIEILSNNELEILLNKYHIQYPHESEKESLNFSWLLEKEEITSGVKNDLNSLLSYLIAEDLYQRIKDQLNEAGHDVSSLPEILPVKNVYALVDYFIKLIGSENELVERLEDMIEKINKKENIPLESSEENFTFDYKIIYYIILGTGLFYLLILFIRRKRSKRSR